MHILWLSAELPLRLGSRIQLMEAQTFAALAAEHDISLLSYESDDHDVELSASLTSACEHVELVAKEFGTSTMREAVARRLHRGGIDAVHIASPELLDAIPSTWVGPLVADVRPAATRDAWLVAELGSHGLRAQVRLRAAAAQRSSVAATYRRATLLLVGSEAERDVVESIVGAPWSIHIVPLGIATDSLEALRRLRRPTEARMLTITGHISFQTKRDIGHFVRNALPKIEAAVPEIRYDLSGDESIWSLRGHQSRDSGLALHADGDDSPLWVEASVLVAPMHSDAAQVALLEAMTLGVPVVTTPEACAGLDAVPGEHLLLGTDPASFADAVISLQADATLAANLTRQARKLIEDSYDLPSALAGLHSAYQHIQRREVRCALCS